MKKIKLKGCRSVEECRLDYTNTAARLGAGLFRITEIQEQMEEHKKRLREIQLELDDATAQEAELAKAEPEAAEEMPASLELSVVQ